MEAGDEFGRSAGPASGCAPGQRSLGGGRQSEKFSVEGLAIRRGLGHDSRPAGNDGVDLNETCRFLKVAKEGVDSHRFRSMMGGSHGEMLVSRSKREGSLTTDSECLVWALGQTMSLRKRLSNSNSSLSGRL